MTPSVDEFLQALGEAQTDGKIVTLLGRLGLGSKKIKPKRGDFDIALDAPEHGVDVVFSDPSGYARKGKDLEGVLVLSSVIFFSEGREGRKQYPSALPGGLTFSDSRIKTRKRLGAPEFSSPILPIDRWAWSGLKLAVAYTDDESAIASVNCDLPKAP